MVSGGGEADQFWNGIPREKNRQEKTKSPVWDELGDNWSYIISPLSVFSPPIT